jgi:putative copper export protein
MLSAAVLLAAARGVQLLGVLSVFGVSVADVIGTAGLWRCRDPLMLGGVAVAWLVAPPWLLLQAGEMAGSGSLPAMAAAMPAVLLHTLFGHALLLRLGLLACLVPLTRRRGLAARLTALLLAAAACLTQIDMGHAAAPDGAWQRVAASAHVLAAGAWIGGLLPLVRAIAEDPKRARLVASRFSLLGIVAVALLGAGGLGQALILVGGLPGLLGTAYGVTLLGKTALFAALLALASWHRFSLTPALGGERPERTARRLRRSIAVEALIGAGAIGVAAWLAGLPPGAHEQPVWPLPWQPSPDAWDDPAVANRVIAGLVVCAVAMAAGMGAWRWRRKRMGAGLAVFGLASVAAACVLAVPKLGAFARPAYPTSFFESPTGFTKASVAAGKPLYAALYESCHGKRGFGDGPAASQAARLAPLTGFHLLERSDGEMFWILSAGLKGTAMPGFDASLSEEQRWVVIDYVRFLAGAEPADVALVLHHHH